MLRKLLIEDGKVFLLNEEESKKEITSSDLHRIITETKEIEEPDEKEHLSETEGQDYNEYSNKTDNALDCHVSELCIDVGSGQAVVLKNNEIEFHDCVPIHIDKLEFVVTEARKFIEYRDERHGKK